MKRNSYTGPAGSGPADVEIFGPNPRRKGLVITYGGSGNLLIAVGKKTASGTVADFILTTQGGPLILPHWLIGDAITEEINAWTSAGSQPVGAMEFFES